MTTSSSSLGRRSQGTATCARAGVLVWLAVVAGCQLAADSYNVQGVRDFNAGNYTAALRQFQEAAAANPRNADALYNLAAANHYQGKTSGNRQQLNEAEVLYNRCLDVNENHVDAHRGLAVLLNETDRPDKAFKLMRNWANSSKTAESRIELARLYEEFGDHTTAQAQLQEAIQLDQNNARAWRALAHLREKDKDYAQALANYQRSYAISGHPQVAERIASLSRTMAGTGTPAAGPTRTVQSNDGGWTTRY